MKALIVDDEPMPAKHLDGLIKTHCYEIGETFILNSPTEAVKHLKDHEYDIIFLDVEMPVLNGLELLEQVTLPLNTHVIFTTAYSQYAVDAFKANATHYLLKMVKKDELIEATRKVMYLKNRKDELRNKPSISVFSGEEHIILRQHQIIRMEANGSYTKIIYDKGELLSTKRLGSYEEVLDQKSFCRCHNSHIINVDRVFKVSKGKKGYVVMDNEEVVPIAAAKREHIINLLGL